MGAGFGLDSNSLGGAAGHGSGQPSFASFLEHPRDPVECSRAPAAKQCSSIWVTEVCQQRAQGVNHQKIHLDQCRLGQVVQQSTTLSTDLPLHHWQGLECNHGGHTKPKEMTSRCPPSLMAGLSDAIIKSLPEEEAPSQGHQSAREPPGRTDRSSSVSLSQAMTLWDDPIIVQSGFKTRPLRHGGGKPSPGRRPPPLRPYFKLARIGESIVPLAQSCAPGTIMCPWHNHVPRKYNNPSTEETGNILF
jgi:hypothetical protein